MTKAPEGTDILCGITALGLASILSIVLMLLLALVLPVHTIERGMVWLSVPWFAFWYLKCRTWHRTGIVFEEGSDLHIDTLPTP